MEKEELIVRSINEMLSLSEEIALRQWIDENHENRDIYNKLQQLDSMTKIADGYHLNNNVKLTKELRRLINRQRRERIGLYTIGASVAAAVLFFAINILTSIDSQVVVPQKAKMEEAALFDTIVEQSKIVAFMRREGSDKLEKIASDDILQKIDKKIIRNTITVPGNGIYTIILSDSTKVVINGGSSFTYPSEFSGESREVTLSGEAFFEVTSNPKRPFIVSANDVKSVVYGTKINVEAYSNLNYVATTLFEGKVKVNGVDVVAGKRAVKMNNSDKVNITDVDLRSIDSWRRGEFYFNEVKLADIARELSKWYDCKMVFEDETSKNEIFTLICSRDKGLDNIIRMLSNTNKVIFKRIGGEMYIETK